MSKTTMRVLKERADRPMDDHALETLVGVAIAAWTFGLLVFTHATVGQLPFSRDFSLGTCCQAVALGCLIAAIASKRFDFKPAGLVGLGVLLFSSISIWNKSQDLRLLVLALLVVAARGMDMRRLLRFFAGAAALALLCVTTLAVTGVTTVRVDPTLAFGFASAKTVACLLLGITSALCLTVEDRRMRIPCAVVCLVCAALAMFILKVRSYAVFMALVGVLVVFQDVIARRLSGIMAHREFGWFMAAAPIVLFCLCQDSDKYFTFASFLGGGYKALLTQYGTASLCCFAVVYVRAALLADRGERTTLAWLLLCVYFVACAFDANTVYLEFNGLLLFLTLGTGRSVISVPAPAVMQSEQGGE